MGDIQNANPTILSVTDLPTRLPLVTHKTGKEDDSLFSSIFAQSRLHEDPFERRSESSTYSEDEDDNIPDVIDEQEIFGRSNLFMSGTNVRPYLNYL
jgi:hypothetical protein